MDLLLAALQRLGDQVISGYERIGRADIEARTQAFTTNAARWIEGRARALGT